MDKKQSKPNKGKMMKFLPRAASAIMITFHKPVSPGKENRPVAGRGFSGPIKMSIIPKEARSKSNKLGLGLGLGLATPEPTSPKVSCIGQIKKKKKIMKGLSTKSTAAVEISEPKKRHPPSSSLMTGGKLPGRAKSNDAAVGLNKMMKRLASGRRGGLANFDWTGQVAPADDVEREETEGGGVWPLQPRKEVNIWKRRTFVPPTPLQL